MGLNIRTLFASVLIIVSSTVYADENYCHDSSVNKEWATLLAQHPNDDAIAKLFAMRLGLCELVERGFIEHDRATKIFEKARAQEVREKRKRLDSQRDGV